MRDEHAGLSFCSACAPYDLLACSFLQLEFQIDIMQTYRIHLLYDNPSRQAQISWP